MATDSQGNTVAVWDRYEQEPETWSVQSAVRPAGGGWQAPVDLSTGSTNWSEPRIAIDPQGDAVAVWRWRSGYGAFVIKSAIRRAGGGWQAPVELTSPEPEHPATEPDVAVDAQGNAVAVWAHVTSISSDVIESATRPAGGEWQAPHKLSEEDHYAYSPQVAVDPQGDAIAVWDRFDGSVSYRIESAVRPAGEDWQTAESISPLGQQAQDPQIAIDSHGNAVAVWVIEGGTSEFVEGATREAGATWQMPSKLSTEGEIAIDPEVAVDAAGEAIAVWDRWEAPGNYTVQAALRPAGGGWEKPPLDVSAVGLSPEQPQVAVDPRGDAMAVWRHDDGSSNVMQAALRPAGASAWKAPADISPAGLLGEATDVAFDPEGNAVALWQRYDGENWIVQGAGYDAAGPQLRSLLIPPTGTVGQAVPFSVSPLDVWSALGSTGWSFGDGGSASGTSAGHTYAAPGTYQVTLTSADALGNATSASAAITIAPPRTGKAFAARVVRVKGGRALLRLNCPGVDACRGVGKLLVRKGHKHLLIGKSAFSVAAGQTMVVRIKLTAKGKALVRRAGKRGLKATLTGPGVVARVVVLKGVRP